jgi:hypothetical protein
LERLVDAAKPSPVGDVKTRPVFTPPVVKTTQKASGPVMQKIQYLVPSAKVSEVKRALGVTTYTDVGIGTFEYFYNAEVVS